MRSRVLARAALVAFGLSSGIAATAQTAAPSAEKLPAFPGAQGWAANTPGGRGGQIIKVTSLAKQGPGTLREAFDAKGPRIIVFEVGGIIDLDGESLKLDEPFVTVAGQTAPSPGITLIRGGIDIGAHDAIVQHIRVRVGSIDKPKFSHEDDSIGTVGGAHDVIVDHCSLTWATDENLSASGPRFKGNDIAEWRQNTSHRITFSNNIIGEGLSYSTHPKGEHSKGSLIHDNVTDLLIVGNLYAHNYERSPLFKGGVHGAIVNNFIFDPGARAIHYNLAPLEWGERKFENGQMVAVGNVLRAGKSTPSPLAFLMIGGDGDLEYYGKDNVAVDRIGNPIPMFGRYTTGPAKIIEAKQPMFWPAGLTALPANKVERAVLAQVGARPWDRDKHDVRLLADVAEGRGEIIDSEAQVGGYPKYEETKKPFVESDWDLRFMTPKNPSVLDSGKKARGT
ncbi:pectate lyase family protein [Roseiterribacter gracilis]|uniref:Pectate lyase n=1 Tax=Roseiterribacter gracilis TaxID=2812848 RepID=A0A8S8XCW7_9PROT|nr:hypothetical protein TMPK1_13030 [Rhodospirillales bacterium TMPK1]